MALLSWMAGLGWVLLPLLGALRFAAEDEADRVLVAAVLDGDPTAYRGLVERYQERVYTVVYGLVRNREDARDLAQESFVRAYQNLKSFRVESSFYTWLYRIAMNTALDHLRRQKMRRHEAYEEGVATRETGSVLSDGAHRDTAHRSLERKQLHARLMAALDELPEDQRQVIVLREVDGLSYKEISEVMEIPEGTVMSRLYYARRKLKSVLTEDAA